MLLLSARFVDEKDELTEETDGVSAGALLFGVPDWLLDILMPFWTTPVLLKENIRLFNLFKEYKAIKVVIMVYNLSRTYSNYKRKFCPF